MSKIASFNAETDSEIARLSAEFEEYAMEHGRIMVEFPQFRNFLEIVMDSSSRGISKAVWLRVFIALRDEWSKGRTETITALSCLPDPYDWADFVTEAPKTRWVVQHYLDELERLMELGLKRAA